MDKGCRKKRLSFGRRTFKTLAATTILAVVYSIFGRNPCFACIGAVFGMGQVFDAGLKQGGNRFIGTILGGVIAIPLYPLYHDQMFGVPGWVYLTLGLAVLLIVSQLVNAGGGVQPGAVVFFVVLLTVAESTYIMYTVNRVIDTGIGVALSLLLNRVFPSPLEEKPMKPLFGRPGNGNAEGR